MRLSTVFELLLIFLFLALASSRHIDKNRLKNGITKQANLNSYCKCTELECNCCRDFPVVPLKGPGCATLGYKSGDQLRLTMSFGERVLRNITLSGKKPKPVCMALPGGISKFCGRLYNIERQSDHFKACLSLELRALDELEAALRISCFNFSPKGVKLQPGEPLPNVVKPLDEDEDDDDDDDDDYELDDDDEEFDDDDDEYNDVDTDGDYTGFAALSDQLFGGFFFPSSSITNNNKKKKPVQNRPVQQDIVIEVTTKSSPVSQGNKESVTATTEGQTTKLIQTPSTTERLTQSTRVTTISSTTPKIVAAVPGFEEPPTKPLGTTESTIHKKEESAEQTEDQENDTKGTAEQDDTKEVVDQDNDMKETVDRDNNTKDILDENNDTKESEDVDNDAKETEDEGNDPTETADQQNDVTETEDDDNDTKKTVDEVNVVKETLPSLNLHQVNDAAKETIDQVFDVKKPENHEYNVKEKVDQVNDSGKETVDQVFEVKGPVYQENAMNTIGTIGQENDIKGTVDQDNDSKEKVDQDNTSKVSEEQEDDANETEEEDSDAKEEDEAQTTEKDDEDSLEGSAEDEFDEIEHEVSHTQVEIEEEESEEDADRVEDKDEDNILNVFFNRDDVSDERDLERTKMEREKFKKILPGLLALLKPSPPPPSLSHSTAYSFPAVRSARVHRRMRLPPI